MRRGVAPPRGFAYAVTVMPSRRFPFAIAAARFALLCALFLALPSAADVRADGRQTPPQLDPKTAERIDQYISEEREAHNIPGVSVAVVGREGVSFAEGYGAARADGTPMTAQTPVHMGSAAQTVTAAALIRLSRNGALELDDRVSAHLDEERLAAVMHNEEAAGEEVLQAVRGVTVKQLLSHTSGISADGRITEDPGEAFIYSDVNYRLAGAVVEAVTRRPYEAYVAENLFAPLSMSDCYPIPGSGSEVTAESGAENVVEERGENLDGSVAQGHARGLFRINAPRSLDLAPREAGSSGLVCSAESGARFLRALLSGGGPVLSRDGVDALLEARGAASGPGVDEDTSYAYGWLVDRVDSAPRVRHAGSAETSQAAYHLYPEDEVGVVVAINVNGPMLFGLSDTLAAGVKRLLAGDTPAPFEPLERAETTNLIVTVLASLSLLRLLASINRFRLRRRRHSVPAVTVRNVLVHGLIPLLIDVVILLFFLAAVPAGFNVGFSGLYDVAFDLFMLSVLGAVPLGSWALLRTVLFFTESRHGA